MTNKNISIAIVDDDDTFQFITSKALRSLSNSNTIIQFSSATDAIHYFLQHIDNNDLLPDVVLVDINMPVLDGWMFLDEFKIMKKKISKEIAFFIVSSSIDKLDVDRAHDDAAVTDYIMKPLTIETYKELLSL